jgi:hypothetical protein
MRTVWATTTTKNFKGSEWLKSVSLVSHTSNSKFSLLVLATDASNGKMAPQLSEDEIDDLLYAARTGDKDELTTLLSSLGEREKVSPAEILVSAKDEGKSTCLHMATGNGHLGESFFFWGFFFLLVSSLSSLYRFIP